MYDGGYSLYAYGERQDKKVNFDDAKELIKKDSSESIKSTSTDSSDTKLNNNKNLKSAGKQRKSNHLTPRYNNRSILKEMLKNITSPDVNATINSKNTTDSIELTKDERGAIVIKDDSNFAANYENLNENESVSYNHKNEEYNSEQSLNDLNESEEEKEEEDENDEELERLEEFYRKEAQLDETISASSFDEQNSIQTSDDKNETKEISQDIIIKNPNSSIQSESIKSDRVSSPKLRSNSKLVANVNLVDDLALNTEKTLQISDKGNLN